jgi:hypothetical protein
MDAPPEMERPTVPAILVLDHPYSGEANRSQSPATKGEIWHCPPKKVQSI